MKVTWKIKPEHIICCLFALYALYMHVPFFTWSTFMGGRFGNFAGLQYSTAIALLGIASFVIFQKNRLVFRRKRKVLLLLLCFSAVLNVVIASNFAHMLSFTWIPYLMIASMLLLPDEYNITAYQIFYRIFTVSLIIPIIVFVLTIAGVSLPYGVLESYEEIKRNTGVYYHLYPFAITRDHVYQTFLFKLQLCGIFDEPGRVGTLCGLFLCAENFKIKEKKSNVILLVAGIMSFSMAFYFLCAIFFLVRAVQDKKRGAIIILLLIVSYFVFINLNFSDPDIQKFQMRFRIVDGVLGGNNRVNDRYMSLFWDGFLTNFKTILFGQGGGALGALQIKNTIDGSSFWCLVFDYGIIGFALQIIWIAVYCFQNKEARARCLPLMMVYLANMYQRPSMFSYAYMIILFGGITKIISEKKMVDTRRIYSGNREIC